jgi:hypothetical protein
MAGRVTEGGAAVGGVGTAPLSTSTPLRLAVTASTAARMLAGTGIMTDQASGWVLTHFP